MKVTFCDEAGDQGFHAGCTATYVPCMIVLAAGAFDSSQDHIREVKRAVLGRIRALEWKTLPAPIKRDDERLAAFLDRLLVPEFPYLASAAIVDKEHTTGRGLKATKTALLMGYTYSLMFRRLVLALDAWHEQAHVYMDRNSSAQVHMAVRSYLEQDLPRKMGVPAGTLVGPVFVEKTHNYNLRLADFIAGLTRTAFESHKSGQNAYPRSTASLHRWFYQNTPNWRWRGLLYHPYQERPRYEGFLGKDA